MIQKLSEPATFDYVIDANSVYRVKTKIIPIIIDMGRAHIIHNNHHYGETDLFSTSTIQDIITILDISIHQVSTVKLQNQAVKQLITLANFLSNSGYRRKPFRETGKNGLGDIRYFFGKAKKYSEIVSSDKSDLESKTPIDFVKYILLNFKLGPKFILQQTDELVYHMNHSNPRQVFDFALSSTARERALTYARALHRLQNIELPQTEYLFQNYYIAQNLAEGLTSLYDQMISYLDEAEIEDKEKFVKKYEKTVKNLEQKFRELIKGKSEIFIEQKITHQNLSYTENTFLFPKKILQLLNTHKKIDNVSDNILEIVEEILLRKKSPYAILPETRKYYKTNIQQISSRHKIRIYIADVNTLHDLASKVYRGNMAELEEKLEQQNCVEAKQLVSIYKKILN
jgi:flagellin-specific chaperone FliS